MHLDDMLYQYMLDGHASIKYWPTEEKKNAEFLGLFTIPLCGQNHNISSILNFTFQLR